MASELNVGKVVASTSADDAKLTLATYSAGSNYSLMQFNKSDTNTVNAAGVTDSSDVLGRIIFAGYGSSAGHGSPSVGADIKVTQTDAAGANHVPSKMVFSTSDSDSTDVALTIDSDGKVGIIQTSMSAQLEVKATGSSGKTFRVTDNAGASSFEVADNGLVTCYDGLSFDQTNTSATGAAATSSVLDHYEMGKWTGAFTAGSGTITIDSSNNEATYIRVGDLVHVEGRFSVSAISSPSGTLGITGLPFTGVADSVVNGETISVGACYFENAASAVTSPIIFGPNGTNSSLEVRESGTTGAGNAPANKVDTGTVILFSISYRCA